MKPIVIYNDKILKSLSWFMPIGGMALFPFIILREKYQKQTKFWIKKNAEVINHETIHFHQAIELGIIGFYILYVLEFIIKLFIYGAKSYENLSFEREANTFESDANYLSIRPKYAWVQYLF